MKPLVLLIFTLLMAFQAPWTAMAYAAEPEAPVEAESDEEWGDEGDDGFGEEGDSEDFFMETETLEVAPVEQKAYGLSGFVEESLAYGYQQDDPDLVKMMTKSGLEADAALWDKIKAKFRGHLFYDHGWAHQGRHHYSDDLLEIHEFRGEVDEFYLDAALADWLHIRVGRQFSAWGDTEGDQLTDLVNSRNMTEPGVLDVEDSREGVAATQVSLFTEKMKLNLAALHEVRTHRLAPKSSPFDSFRPYREAGLVIHGDETPADRPGNTEFLARFSRNFSWGDLHLMFADVYDDMPFLDYEGVTGSGALAFTPRHKRIKAWGAMANYVTGSFVFKGEAVYKTGRGFERGDLADQLASGASDVTAHEEKNTLQAMAGLEYNGIKDVYATLELVGSRVLDHDDRLITGESSAYTTLIVTHDALRDTLETELTASWYPDDDELLLKLTATYDLTDAWRLYGGIVIYESSEPNGLIYPFRKNDRIIGSIRYNF